MEKYAIYSCVRGGHVSKHFQTPTIGQALTCKRELGKVTDLYVVAVIANSMVVGHILRKISANCYYFCPKMKALFTVQLMGKGNVRSILVDMDDEIN